jgi:hypothetical protein
VGPNVPIGELIDFLADTGFMHAVRHEFVGRPRLRRS